jgi:hypothetical protein
MKIATPAAAATSVPTSAMVLPLPPLCFAAIREPMGVTAGATSATAAAATGASTAGCCFDSDFARFASAFAAAAVAFLSAF